MAKKRQNSRKNSGDQGTAMHFSGTLGSHSKILVDVEDYPLVVHHKWYYDDGYAYAHIDGRKVRMHRYVMQENNPEVVIDHRNGDRSDNRKSNLRRYSLTENANNRVDNRDLVAFGEAKTIGEWAADPRCQVNYNTLYGRVRKGITPVVAILAPTTT